jgi:hypothetical protein
MVRLAVVDEWGSSAVERSEPFPCDDLGVSPDRVLFRAIDIVAPPEQVFRWLCQLRVAPYSYDWLDNLGRRSPRELTEGVEQLEIGQRMCTIFTLAHFEPGRSLTLDHRGVFGRVAITYRVTPRPGGSRLVVKLLWVVPGSIARPLLAALLPAGDLVMMRKQLRTFKALAERDARR